MAGNPLTDPNWPSTLADQVEQVVGTVREKATAPVIHGARAVVYGLLIFIIAIPVVVLACWCSPGACSRSSTCS